MQRLFLRAYFFGALPVPLADAAAAVVFGFSFFGFLASRFPFGMAAAPSSGLSVAPVGEITSVRPKFPQWIARVSPEIPRRDPYRLRVKETTMPRVNLTQKIVEAAPLPLGRKSVDCFDRRMPGLVSAGGTKSWNAIYRHHGRARRLTLGVSPFDEIVPTGA